jgi:predicted nicotinamide N-methyase
LRTETLDLNFSGYSILHVNQLDVKNELTATNTAESTNAESSSIKDKTDLVTGVYEGGFKIWECSYDLLSHLQKITETEPVKNLNVLDLGCGSGVLGIACALQGAGSVTFQDYNAEVIKGITMPNYLANIGNRDDLNCKSHFVSGPWDTFCKSISKYEKAFDLILTSETIYNTSHYSSLIAIFDFCLSAKGRVLLAAKVNYFGVGGGVRQFEKDLVDLNSDASKWSFQTVQVLEDNVKREIVQIKRKE